jgi:hypothetical protein
LDASILLQGPLVRLTYASLRAPQVSDDDIVDLALHANRNNRHLDVTGCLWVGDHRFFQVLEGPQAQVDALYRRIQADPRHVQVRLLSYGLTRERQFARWNLAHVTRDEDATLDACIAEYAGVRSDVPAEQREASALHKIVDRLVAIVRARHEPHVGQRA